MYFFSFSFHQAPSSGVLHVPDRFLVLFQISRRRFFLEAWLAKQRGVWGELGLGEKCETEKILVFSDTADPQEACLKVAGAIPISDRNATNHRGASRLPCQTTRGPFIYCPYCPRPPIPSPNVANFANEDPIEESPMGKAEQQRRAAEKVDWGSISASPHPRIDIIVWRRLTNVM